MANVNSLTTNSNSYSSSLYGSRNVISGLATGMDTESMIENSVSGYKAKISQLQQQIESITWKQDAFRSITDKMIALMEKYTSYTSKTNLTSKLFFNQAVKTIAGGTYASKVSATGKSSSDIKITSVESLASAAKYTVSADKMKNSGSAMSLTGGEIDWGKTFTVGEGDDEESKSTVEYLSGKSVNVEYNGTTKSISLTDFAKAAEEKGWGEGELTDELAKYLQKGVDSAFGAGKVTVGTENGGLSFGVKEGSGATLKVTSSAGEALGIDNGVSNYFNTGKTLGDLLGESYFNGTDEDGNPKETVDFVINGVSVGEFGKDATLQSVLDAINNNTEAGVKVSFSSLTSQFVFTTTQTGADQKIEFGEGLAGDLFKADNSPQSIKLGDLFGNSGITWDDDGYAELDILVDGSYMYDIKINKNDSLASLQSKLDPTHRNIIVYDEETDKYSFRNGYPEESAKGIVFSQSGGASISLAELKDAANTNSNFTAGSDAVLTAEINGQKVTLQRDSNTVYMDGLSVTLKGTFTTNEAAGEEPVTFETHSDADNIVNTVKSFVEEYNAILKEIHDAYTTQPLRDTSGNKYSPLTDNDKASMSDGAIASYEEKAKTGLLFADSDLSMLYGKMRDIFSSSALSAIGLGTTYSSGLTQLSLDEDKLRKALEDDPDKVRNAFTDSKALGGTSDGVMTKVKSVFDTYASKSIATPGILVKKAGTKLSSTSLQSNTLQKQIDSIQKQIDKWQTKLSTKIDYYTRQFTALESLMSSLNNQSSMLTSMMGG